MTGSFMARIVITREKIIEAALASAFEKGMGATSLADISQLLEIKKASLYNHFTSKDDILQAVYVYCSDSLNNVRIFPEYSEEDFKATLICAVERFILIHERNPLYGVYVLVNTEKYFSNNVFEIYENRKNKIVDEVFLFFKTANTKGFIKNLDDENIKKKAEEFCMILFSVMDSYLLRRKEAIRKNPESGAGSLFELPSDTNELNVIKKTVGDYFDSLA